jgi:hypothetical protein
MKGPVICRVDESSEAAGATEPGCFGAAWLRPFDLDSTRRDPRWTALVRGRWAPRKEAA